MAKNKAIYNTVNFRKIQGIHPKFEANIVMMLSANIMPYYAEFATFMNFYKTESIPTCGVNVSNKGMNFYWNSKFVNSLTDTESLFLLCHEEFHLLFDHSKRSISYNKELANIVKDMIINQIIYDEIQLRINTNNKVFIEIPKNHEEFLTDEKDNPIIGHDGKPIKNPFYNQNTALFIPKEYNGEPIFENLYQWVKEQHYQYKKRKEKIDEQQQQQQSNDGTQSKKGKQSKDPNGNQNGQGQGNEQQDPNGNQNGQGQGNEQQDPNGQGQGDGNQQKTSAQSNANGDEMDNGGDGSNTDSFGNPRYGDYGQNGVQCQSLDSIFDSMEKGNKNLTLDSHIADDVQEQARKSLVNDFQQKLKNRGLQSAEVEAVLNKLKKSKKNYLKEIKRTVSNHIIGTSKRKSITRPNRRSIEGIKGKKKYKNVINVILDTSGSMGGDFERVLSYIFQNDIHINLIQIDTEVKVVEEIKNKHELEKMKIRGLGGTVLQPAINFIANPINKLNKYNTCILTDGYTDHLDFTHINGKSLILTTGVAPGTTDPHGRVKCIVVDRENSIYG